MSVSIASNRFCPSALGLCIAAALSLGVSLPALAQVTNCSDAGPGSLREQLGGALTGETVSLVGLQCSRITLTSGEIVVSAQNVDLAGDPDHIVTIDAGLNSRIVRHTGFGNLDIEYVELANGKYDRASGTAAGGCVYSRGNINAVGILASGCVVDAENGDAKGGALYGSQGLVVFNSTITGSTTNASGGDAKGGGLYSGYDMRLHSSTVTGNNASGDDALGGGVFSLGDALIEYSTIDNNSAQVGGGLYLHAGPQPSPSVVIALSTISGNTANRVGGLFSHVPLVLVNSTITANGEVQQAGAGVYAIGASQFYSSIIAGNRVGASGVSDLGGGGSPSVTGSNNIIGLSLFPNIPSDSVSTDPRLKPLADNGGITRTHALLPTSPAINHGFLHGMPTDDQRGTGFRRVVGSSPDIGAFEFDGDIIFANGFN